MSPLARWTAINAAQEAIRSSRVGSLPVRQSTATCETAAYEIRPSVSARCHTTSSKGRNAPAPASAGTT